MDSQEELLSADRAIEELKSLLLVKGAKCKLQFSTREKEYYNHECGFTDEEKLIFDMRTRGFSVQKICMNMNYETGEYWSTSRVESRIRAIKDKILAIL